MPLPILKLAEVMARALFTVGAIFLLPAREGGQFGLVVTLVSLFAFAFGWERHIDIQRRFSGMPAHVVDGATGALPRFYLANYALMAPVLFLLALTLGRLEWELALLVVVIAIAEHHASAAYNYAVMEPRYRLLVALAAVRGVVLVAVVAALRLIEPALLRLDVLLMAWAVTGAASSGLMMLAWPRIRQRPPVGDDGAGRVAILRGVFAQHRASLHHFLIGALAVIAIQVDRLVVGTFLPLEQVGVYFRHVLLVSFIYQFFNVASYNRRVAAIFAAARQGAVGAARAIIRREELLVVAASALGIGAMAALALTPLDGLLVQYSLSVALMAILVAGAVLRIFADFEALLLNAAFRERRLLVHQFTSVGAGAAAMAGLTLLYGITGTALGALGTSAGYFALNRVANARLSGQQAAS